MCNIHAIQDMLQITFQEVYDDIIVLPISFYYGKNSYYALFSIGMFMVINRCTCSTVKAILATTCIQQ